MLFFDSSLQKLSFNFGLSSGKTPEDKRAPKCLTITTQENEAVIFSYFYLFIYLFCLSLSVY